MSVLSNISKVYKLSITGSNLRKAVTEIFTDEGYTDYVINTKAMPTKELAGPVLEFEICNTNTSVTSVVVLPTTNSFPVLIGDQQGEVFKLESVGGFFVAAKNIVNHFNEELSCE